MTPQEKLTAVLSESRNGMNEAFRLTMFGPIVFSDGAKEALDAAGAYWLADILATEVAPKLKNDINIGKASTVLVGVVVKNRKADIKVTDSDDGPVWFSKKIDYTDFPEGDWMLFEMGAFDWDGPNNQTNKVIAALISEH